MNSVRWFRALPPYLGSKRRLASKIVSLGSGRVFADAFMGGGSVSLLAKAKGFRVIANDLAPRCAPVGYGLIRNDGTTRLELNDLKRLFAPQLQDLALIRTKYRHYFMPRHAKFIAQALANIKAIQNPVKHALLQLLVIRVALWSRPFNVFTELGILRKHQTNTLDESSSKTRRWLGHVSDPIWYVTTKLAEGINAGIFSNGQQNEFHALDARQFVKDVDADTVYLDPPYWGSTDYEGKLGLLNGFISDDRPDLRKFNRNDALDELESVLANCTHIPNIILSFGTYKIGRDEILRLVRRFRRKARLIPVKHRHMLAAANGSWKDVSNIEILIHARN